MMPRFLDLFDMDFFLVALRYTLMEHDTLDNELPHCQRRDVGIVIGGVFSSGITATGAVPGAKYNYAEATPDVLDKVRRIEAVCARYAVPIQAAALQFPFGHPSVTSVIPGAFRADQIAANLGHFRHVIPAAFWEELRHERLIRDDAPLPNG